MIVRISESGRGMNAKTKRRFAFAAALVASGCVLAGVIVYGLGQNTMYFRSPTDIADKQVGEGVAFRLGGLVEKGSVHHGMGADVHFRVTDGKSTVAADYNGVLPPSNFYVGFAMNNSTQSPSTAINGYVHWSSLVLGQRGNSGPTPNFTGIADWSAYYQPFLSTSGWELAHFARSKQMYLSG